MRGCSGGRAWLLGGMRGCSGGEGHAWLLWGGMRCVVALGGHVWLLWEGGCVWLLQGGHAWFYLGGMRVFFSFLGYNEIWSISRQYASYWNAFLYTAKSGLHQDSMGRQFEHVTPVLEGIDFTKYFNKTISPYNAWAF